MKNKNYFPNKNLTQMLSGVWIWVFLPAFLLAGCGYRLTPTGEKIGQDIKKVYIDVFTNSTAEANIETTFRNAFIDRFIKGRRFKKVDSEEMADAVLKGDIKNIAFSHLAYRNDNLALEQRIKVTLSLTFQEQGTKKVIWRDENYSQWEDYLYGVEITTGERNKESAIIKLANDVSERTYRLMIADF